ncbi:MAG: hypothetical protein RBG1_1C00001G0031 [candidate division Zixibacteria bacterium RBG-1]|nr:MAG: hypothetical protein RBG1_1C00001G0031 [candidate division Zixibacteria bacterium RBG-1]OGC85603.1 MAG: hypothetical protein A2V73_04635 [candidate division Zixibacteria bacterium RBG_19FT_COMBO_42_43]
MKIFYLEILVLALAFLIFVVDLVFKKQRANLIPWVVSVGLFFILGLSFIYKPQGSFFSGAAVSDSLALFFKKLFLMAGFISSLGVFSFAPERFSKRQMEYFFLLLVSLSGMMLVSGAKELIFLFVSFEIMSFPLYVLAGFLKKEAFSVEAALKFFLLGTVSSALILYGFSFVYGMTGSTYLDKINTAAGNLSGLFYLGISLILAGFCFKIAAVPFHMWVPDTYQGAPTPFVAFLSVAPKAAGFVVLLRLFWEGFLPAQNFWRPQMILLSALSMIVGNLLALPQKNIKRLLAYSGIAHIGYALLGLLVVTHYGISMLLFYLAIYLFANMGAFLIVELVYRTQKSDELEAYAGLAQRSPLVALCLLLFLLSLGGIPFLAGFWAKLYIFLAAAQQKLWGLVFLGAVLSVVALFYYLKIARVMYIQAPLTAERLVNNKAILISIILTVIPLLIFGLYPKPLVELVNQIARQFLP